MISFDIVSERVITSFLQSREDIFDNDELSYLSEALYSFLALSEEMGAGNVAVCLYEHFLLVRIFDGERYVFPFPINLSAYGGEGGACYAIAEYALKEEISLYISDVGEHEFALLKFLFRTVYKVGESEGYSTVKVVGEAEAAYVKYSHLALTPCKNGFEVHSFVELLPTIEKNRLVIYPMRYSEDAEDYARLSFDSRVNRFWGYDLLADLKSTDPCRIFAENLRQMEDGQILSFAISIGGAFAGEVLIYAFDLMGGAEVGIRLFPKFWGQGLASEVLKMIIPFSKDIGLSELVATVDCENVRSINFFAKYAIGRCEKKHPYNNRAVTVFKLL